MLGTYSPFGVVLSYAVAFLGAYVAICACEQYRCLKLRKSSPSWSESAPWLFIIGGSFGGVSIWCMHFIAMSALTIFDKHHKPLEVEYNMGVSILTMFLAVVSVCLGVWVASHDHLFAKSKQEILEIHVLNFQNLSLHEIRQISHFNLLKIICTKDLNYLVAGGMISAAGVCVMHYVGMTAMEFHGRIQWDEGIIVGSIFIVMVGAVTAFWILFRLLSIYPEVEGLRIVAAVVLGGAVTALHFVMTAATNFTFSQDSTHHLAWRTDTLQQSRTLYPVLLSAMIALWIFSIYIFQDMRWRVNRYRRYIMKKAQVNGASAQSIGEVLESIELDGGSPRKRPKQLLNWTSIAPAPLSSNKLTTSESSTLPV